MRDRGSLRVAGRAVVGLPQVASGVVESPLSAPRSGSVRPAPRDHGDFIRKLCRACLARGECSKSCMGQSPATSVTWGHQRDEAEAPLCRLLSAMRDDRTMGEHHDSDEQRWQELKAGDVNQLRGRRKSLRRDRRTIKKMMKGIANPDTIRAVVEATHDPNVIVTVDEDYPYGLIVLSMSTTEPGIGMLVCWAPSI